MDRRSLVVLFAVLLSALVALGARLFWLQIVRSADYRVALGERRDVELLVSLRGPILARDATVLAQDVRSFDLAVVLDEFEKDPGGVAALAALVGAQEAELSRRLARIREQIERLAARRPPRERKRIVARERRTPYPLVSAIPFEAAYDIFVHPERHRGLEVGESVRRVHPQGATAAHLVGYVGWITQEERSGLAGDAAAAPELYEVLGPDGMQLLARRGAFDRLVRGRTGAEAAFDDALDGGQGVRLRSRRRGEAPVEVMLVEPRHGRGVRLALDLGAQRAAEGALAGWKGAVVVVDVRDGGLVVSASAPSFDPDDVAACQADEARPLWDRARRAAYPPGSVFKVATAIAGLASGVLTPDRVIDCCGIFSSRFPSRLRCWIYVKHGGAHGPLDLAGALERSCNIYFYTIAGEMGSGELLAWARQLGLGEGGGQLPYATRATLDQTATWAIGQGEMVVTPLEVARMMAAVAGGGRLPRVRVSLDEPVEFEDRVPAEAVAALWPGLERVVAGEFGTAKYGELDSLGMSGKTGSAQAGGDRKPYAWFAGFFPRKSPRYAVAVVLEEAQSGGHDAGPVAAAVATALLVRP